MQLMVLSIKTHVQVKKKANVVKSYNLTNKYIPGLKM